VNNSAVPLQVSGLLATDIAGGAFHAIAIKTDSTLVSWGRNDYGQLGDSTLTQSTTPVAVKDLTGIVGIAAGTNWSLAVSADDVAFSWGRNPNGQLGDGTLNTPRLKPGAVLNLCDISVGVNDNALSANNIAIYPNPTQNKFTVEIGKNVTLEILNLQGQLISKFNLINPINTIDVSELTRGVYMLYIKSENELTVKKMIKH
jgi:hypothetical protein